MIAESVPLSDFPFCMPIPAGDDRVSSRLTLSFGDHLGLPNTIWYDTNATTTAREAWTRVESSDWTMKADDCRSRERDMVVKGQLAEAHRRTASSATRWILTRGAYDAAELR